MVSHHPGKFGGYRHYGDGDTTFLVANSKIPHARLNPSLLLISDKHGMSCSHTEISEGIYGYFPYHVNTSDLVTTSGATIEKNSEKTLASPSRFALEKKKKKKIMAMAKLFALHANVKSNKRSNYFLMFGFSN